MVVSEFELKLCHQLLVTAQKWKVGFGLMVVTAFDLKLCHRIVVRAANWNLRIGYAS